MLTPEDQTVLLPQETQPLLSSMENLVKPVCGVNSVELQTIWTEEYAARGLDRQPIGFACFLTRCRRQELLQFVQTSLAIPNEKITNIIHCNEGFFLVFEKKVVPNRDRWKKYKNRIIPEIFNIEYCCVPAKTPSSDDSFEELRDHIEKISNGYGCLCYYYVEMPLFTGKSGNCTLLESPLQYPVFNKKSLITLKTQIILLFFRHSKFPAIPMTFDFEYRDLKRSSLSL